LAIERTGEIINELFPKIYDTQRTIQILGDDGKPDMVEINKPQIIDGVAKVQHDMSAGTYDVVMEQGPSYATKREQAQDGMTEFIRAFPPAAPLIGDIYAKSMDWPHAQEIGERLEEALPPPIKAKLQAERQQAEQTSGKPPAPPTPQQQQQMQAEAEQKQIQQQEIALKMAEQKANTDKAEAEARKATAEADRAEAEAALMKQRVAAGHMQELRTIEAHDHTMAREHVAHHQTTAHAQDRHEVDMTQQGLDAAGKLANLVQGAQRHQTAMTAPEPAEAE
jgi:pyruvate/2-oxoglutarate dehydrogenase complex dihydrolipoamide acyltransferase (E2) component